MSDQTYVCVEVFIKTEQWERLNALAGKDQRGVTRPLNLAIEEYTAGRKVPGQ